MSLEHDDNLDLATARVVRLAGRDFYIAPLPLRQILAIADHVPKLSGITAETMSGERLLPLAEVLWHGLRRAHPKLTRDEFLDLPIPLGELVAALPVVIEQAGGRRIDDPPPIPPPPAGEGAVGVMASASQRPPGARSSLSS